MIIQCEKCRTKFRLDDSRVKDNGVKVRCTKCKHVFRVQRDEQEAGSLDQGALTAFSSPAFNEEMPSATPEDTGFSGDESQDSPFDSTIFEDVSSGSEPDSFSTSVEPAFDSSSISFESDVPPAAGTVFDTDALAFEDTSAKGGDVDFSSFDFGDSESVADSNTPSFEPVDDFTGTSIKQASAVPLKEAPQGLDFSDDDIFGAVVPAAPEESGKTITFDFEGDSFAESMHTGGHDSSGKSGALFSFDTSGDSPFNLGEIDFGDELTSVAVQQVNPEDLQPSQELLFAPLAKAQEKTLDEDLKRSFLGDDAVAEQQELPPLSISSRRKRSPVYGAVIAVISLLVVSVVGYSLFSTSKGTSTTQDTGKIVVNSVKAAFVKNDKAGELLVISGDALNQYPKPRAALQVKVTVFDSTGGIIATKAAYGGNPLTDEQLATMPLDKIEAAMTNQFGDSLANMEVAPDKSVPFVVVLANLPKGAKDFEVLPAGSTVATGKQQ